MLRSEKVLKLLLIGDGGTGKTSLRQRFLGEGFKKDYIMTIGADFAIYKYESKKHGNVKLQIWDLAGQSHFSAVRPPFYAGCHGLIFVYDVTNLDTLENAQDWLREALKFAGKPVPVGYLANKTDIRKKGNRSHITKTRGRRIVKKVHDDFKLTKFPLVFFETSAKTGINVAESFLALTDTILDPLLK
ncbi:MAG: GTP-binding protein [Candidatus Hodarchaeales archaeon]|jgi:small GTP-binding protein